MEQGKGIQVFLPEGVEKGIAVATIANWNGEVIRLPRSEVKTYESGKLSKPGVYFLFAKEEGEQERIYIGESENVKKRLIQHIQDYASESGRETFYWQTAIVLLGGNLNKAIIRYLENAFIKIAKKRKQYVLLNKEMSPGVQLANAQITVAEEYMDYAKLAGYMLKTLDLIDQQQSDEDETLLLQAGGADAKGKEVPEGFAILKGSKVNMNGSMTNASDSLKQERIRLIHDGIIKDGIVTEDITMSSPSAAATIVLGYSVSGLINWKDGNGRTLKEIMGS